MDISEWKDRIGKRFFFKLNSGGCYTGYITAVDDRFDNLMISINDKFGQSVGFREDTIIKWSEETNSKPINGVINKS